MRRGKAELLGFAELVMQAPSSSRASASCWPKPREDRPGGPFISFPSRRGNGASQDRYFEVAHPITALRARGGARPGAQDLRGGAGKARGREESRNAPDKPFRELLASCLNDCA